MRSLLLLCTLAASTAAFSQSAYHPPKDLRARIDAYVGPLVADRDFAGSILVAQHGKVLFRKSYGMADLAHGVRNRPETEFGIGSISKQFTAAALLILQDQGKLSIEDPLSKFVPGFPSGDKITLRMMLKHQSGIARDLPPDTIAVRRTPQEVVDLIKSLPLDFQPGSKTSYSNDAYKVLGYVIEKVSGSSYLDFLRVHIFTPLGMRSTGELDEQEVIPKLSTGYNPWIGALRLGPSAPHSDSNGIGSGSLYSTVDDLYRWDRAFAGTSILSEESKKQMLSDALGVDVEKVFDRTLVTHNGVYYGYTGFVERYVEDDVSIIYLGNVETGASVTPLETALRAIVFSKPYSAPEIPVVSDRIVVEHPDDYVGVYNVFPGLDLTVTRKGADLLLGAGDGYWPLEPQSDGTFFYRLKFSVVEFMRDQFGKARALKWTQDGHTFDCRRIS